MRCFRLCRYVATSLRRLPLRGALREERRAEEGAEALQGATQRGGATAEEETGVLTSPFSVKVCLWHITLV